ncbi:MAG TPA: ester cyclase [Chloroflexia bacterium]|nr:ester cyclase [Chloroflexia bacterium]
MTTEENKALIQRLVDEVWNTGNLAVATELYAPDYVNHDPVLPDVRGIQEFAAWFTQLRTAMPDFHVEINDTVAEGDRVAKRWAARGTHMADYLGVPPTGEPVELEGTTTYRIANGKIAECWWSYDPKQLRPHRAVPSAPELAATR